MSTGDRSYSVLKGAIVSRGEHPSGPQTAEQFFCILLMLVIFFATVLIACQFEE